MIRFEKEIKAAKQNESKTDEDSDIDTNNNDNNNSKCVERVTCEDKSVDKKRKIMDDKHEPPLKKQKVWCFYIFNIFLYIYNILKIYVYFRSKTLLICHQKQKIRLNNIYYYPNLYRILWSFSLEINSLQPFN